MRIGIIGGTGREGKGLAVRWARAGHQVVIGSRDAARAREHAAALAQPGSAAITGSDNESAIRDAGVVVLTVPYSAHADTLRTFKPALADRILIDITVPLRPPGVTEVHLPPGQAAALEAQEILGPSTPVVAALHHVSSAHLGDPSYPIDCDVLVCSDSPQARQTAIELIVDLGLWALDAGPLRNAIALESLTPVLLYLNKKYKVPGTGIRFTGLP